MPLVTPAVALLLVAAPLAAAAQGVEAGPSASAIGVFPGFGGLVTVPAGPKLSLEAGVETYPWVLEDGDDEFRLLTQIQARIPWAARPGLRRSFIAGVTVATVGDKRTYGGSRDWEFQHTFFPHGGLSWQWGRSPRVDLRLDVTAMVAVIPWAIPIPKVQFATIWHGRRGAR